MNASMGPRSVDRGKDIVYAQQRAQNKLQWGLDLLIEERRRLILWPRGQFASMGPRSVDRGKRRVLRKDGVEFLLQWGLDLLIEERGLVKYWCRCHRSGPS